MSNVRDEMRARLLATRKPSSKVITFFGEKIEIRQPLLGDVLKAREQEDREKGLINTLVMYAFIPNTEEKIFEESDAEVLMGQPFGGDFLAVAEALEGFTKVNFLDKSSSSNPTPQDSSSVVSATNSDSAKPTS